MIEIIGNVSSSSSSSSPPTPAVHRLQCVEGMILPVWSPLEDVAKSVIVGRGIVYLMAMVYLFLGVAILADRFMASIEMITSKKKVILSILNLFL